MHLSICGATHTWFGFWMAFFRSPLSQMKSVPVMRGIFLCIHGRWGKCSLLSALVSRPDTTLGVSKVLGWEAGAEQKYPTSTMFNAQRLLPCCSDTRLLFFLFVLFSYFFLKWNLRRELQNTKQLWLWLPLWVPFPPPVVTGSRGKAKAVRSLQKKEKLVLAESAWDNLSAVKFESLVPAGVMC